MQEGLSTELGGVSSKSVPLLLPLLFNSHTITFSLLSVQWFLVYSQGCAPITTISRTFSLSQRNPVPTSNHSPQFPLPQATTSLLSVSADLPILDTYILFNIYLFIWLHRILVAIRGIFVAACGVFVVACGI